VGVTSTPSPLRSRAAASTAFGQPRESAIHHLDGRPLGPIGESESPTGKFTPAGSDARFDGGMALDAELVTNNG
jgi:hypothetical protein